MGYEDDMIEYNTSIDYETTLQLEWKQHQIVLRAEQIARETRIRLGEEHNCHGFNIQCDCEMPEFQEQLHPAHNFNKYLMEQRIRYGGQS
jgi:hypothetical protein